MKDLGDPLGASNTENIWDISIKLIKYKIKMYFSKINFKEIIKKNYILTRYYMN
jgi:hypothetical protein